jgi:hypothetical protein
MLLAGLFDLGAVAGHLLLATAVPGRNLAGHAASTLVRPPHAGIRRDGRTVAAR